MVYLNTRHINRTSSPFSRNFYKNIGPFTFHYWELCSVFFQNLWWNLWLAVLVVCSGAPVSEQGITTVTVEWRCCQQGLKFILCCNLQEMKLGSFFWNSSIFCVGMGWVATAWGGEGWGWGGLGMKRLDDLKNGAKHNICLFTPNLCILQSCRIVLPVMFVLHSSLQEKWFGIRRELWNEK